MPILDTLIKCYKCDAWASSGNADFNGHGGAIAASLNSSTLIASGVLNNIFDDITNDQRQDPTVSKEYRKIYIRNENTDAFPGTVIWLSALGGGGVDSTIADNDTIKMMLAGNLSKMGESVTISQATGTFVTGSAIVATSASCVGLVAPGEKIYNGATGADATELTKAATVLSVSATEISLASAYGGISSGAGGTINIAPINQCYSNFVKPLTKTDALLMNDLPANGGSAPLWLMREVTVAGGPGYNENRFIVNVEMS